MGGEAAGELGELPRKSTVWLEWAEKENGLPTFLALSQELNLSYQDLGDPYQLENFVRILRRLIRVEKLQLIDNSLINLSSVRLPR